MNKTLTTIFTFLLASCASFSTNSVNQSLGCESAEECIVTVHSKIVENWNEPEGMSENIFTIVEVNIEPTGAVKNVAIAKSSGNLEYDQSAIAAIKSSEPFTELEGLGTEEFNHTFSTLKVRFSPKGQ